MRSRILVIFLGALAATQACSTDRTSDPSVEAVASAAKAPAKAGPSYDWMGKFHNDALDYALVKINSSKKTAKLDRCKVGLKAVKEFSREFRKSTGAHLQIDPDVIDGMCEAQTPGSSALYDAVYAPTNTISPVAESYMNQIVDALDYSASTSAYASTVNQITNAASGALGGGSLEAAAVFGTGSIGVSSNEYWASNSGSWSEGGTVAAIAFPSPTKPVFQVSSRTRRLAKIDAAAAVSVLVRDWWMGELVIEKAAISAAAASLIAAIMQS